MPEQIKSVLLFLTSFVVLLMLWQWTVDWFAIPAYFLPTPGAIGRSLRTGLIEGTFYPDIWATLSATVAGYVLGCLAAIALGILFTELPLLERILNPYIVALQAIPKVALAPLIIVWFGYGLESKVVMVALICFFPVFVNVIVGIRATNPDLISLFTAFSASRMSILFNLKLPSAAGIIFAGLQVSIVFALIGTVVTEFVAARAGLGVLINASMTTFDIATMFSAIFILAVLGIIGNEMVRVVHAKVVFWEGERR
jgi:NitT/TauT family transport system permease protein